MPSIPFSQLPDSARVWIFAASDPLVGEPAKVLLAEVDAYLAEWKAHGLPLTTAREWRDDRFLAIGVDQRDAHASGCSIDGLFRVLQRLQQSLGTSLVGGGRIFYRSNGSIVCVSRADFASYGASGRVAGDTPVFDTTVTSAGAYRSQFERPASAGWHGALLDDS